MKMNLSVTLKKSALVIVSVICCVCLAGSGVTADIDYKKTLRSVARHIASLKKDFPQLKEFSPAKNTDLENLSISYGYHTHQAQHRGGWTSGVPNPDDDGVWFYIDFHDPDSTSQIHTQPVVRKMCLGNKIAFMLILEGKNIKPVGGAIWAILENHGAKPCEPNRRSDTTEK
jgi:hypothetical protein